MPRSLSTLAALALASACSDYAFQQAVDKVEPGTSPECHDPMPGPYAPALEPSCEGEPVVGAFDPVTVWHWTDNAATPGFEQVMATPVVAPLVDTNGDGAVDDADRPIVVFTAFSYGTSYAGAGALVAVNGDGTTRWSTLDVGGHAPYATSGVAIADLGDGLGPAILVTALDGLLCVNPDGSLRWLAPVAPYAYGSPAVGDVEGDGVAEIAYGPAVVNADGTVRWTGAAGTGGYMSFFADVDGQGDAELVTGSAVYASDGSVFASDGGNDGYPAIADLDGDGLPEVIVVGGGGVRAWEATTGAPVWTAAFAAPGGGAPTVADLDGDGLPEVGAANSTYYQVFDGDGTELWRNAVQDFSSAITSSSVFDFEGDGAAEIVYADELTLWVYDGATGAVEMAWDSHASGTLLEYPVIVDLDGDGSAEIVVASNDYAFTGSRGITAIGDANATWAAARSVWNQGAYSITNVDDAGTIPRAPIASWQSWNSFRAGNSETASGLALPDLAAGPPDLCLDACQDGTVSLWAAVENQATRNVDPAWVAVIAGDGTELARASVAAPPGSTAWAGPFTIDVSAWEAGPVTLVVDPDGVVAECDESDDVWTLQDFPCEKATTTATTPSAP